MFPYQGSKQKELSEILPKIPLTAHVMVDVFGGAGSVFLAMIRTFPAAKIIYNDINEHLAAIFMSVAIGKAAYIEDKIKEMLTNHTLTPEGLANLKVTRGILIDQEEKDKDFLYNEDVADHAARTLYLMRTSAKGLYMNRAMVNQRAIPKKKKLTDYDEIVDDESNIMSVDYRKIMNIYKTDPNAFLYLDPPYNSKNTSTASYYAMSGDFHNYLSFIEEFMKSPDTKCKVMLNIDFTGDVYVRFSQMLKHIYRVRYSAQTSINDGSKPPLYHVICTNY